MFPPFRPAAHVIANSAVRVWTAAVLLLVATSIASGALAAEVTILTAGAFKPVLLDLAPGFAAKHS